MGSDIQMQRAQAAALRVDNLRMTEMRSSAPRSTVALDAATGGLRMGSAERRLDDPADTEQVYGAYLSLLYAVRGARRGEEVPLRSADLDALLAIVGEDTDQIERRLVELMGCTAEEASMLRRVLVRHRALAASVGAVAGLSLVALLGPTVASATSAPAPAPTTSTVTSDATITPADPTELPALTSYATTDDGEHVPVPESWTTSEETGTEEQQVAVTSVSPSPSPSGSPSPSVSTSVSTSVSAPASPSPSTTPSPTSLAVSPQAAPEDEVVLGDPTAPIDRPGWSPEDEVVLGDPMAPIDRPGWSPVDEVVLGDPMVPVDQPEWNPEDHVLPPNTGAPIDRPGWSPEDEVVLGEPMTPIDRAAAGEGDETPPTS